MASIRFPSLRRGDVSVSDGSRSLRGWPVVAMAWMLTCAAGLTAQITTITPDDPGLTYGDYAWVDVDSERTVFRRNLITTTDCCVLHSPGARITFRTDATALQLGLDFHNNCAEARCWAVRYEVDGVLQPQQVGVPDSLGEQWFVFGQQATPVLREISVILPYWVDVDFLGVRLLGGAPGLSSPPPVGPRLRCVAYGDSLTHGVAGGDVARTYPYRLGIERGWSVVNLGFGGHQIQASDGTGVGFAGGDVVNVLMGTNAYKEGAPLADFRSRYAGFLDNLRAVQPDALVLIITPLWRTDELLPNAEGMVLEDYRQLIRDLVAERTNGDSRMHLIEGQDLLLAEAQLYEDTTHPTDHGFKLMAKELARLNMVREAGFERAGVAWELTGLAIIGSTRVHTGEGALALLPGGEARQVLYGVGPGRCLELRGWGAVGPTAAGISVELRSLDAGGALITSEALTFSGLDFEEQSLPVVTPPGTVQAELLVTNTGSAGIGYLDDLLVEIPEPGLGLVYGCDGSLTTSIALDGPPPNLGGLLRLRLHNPLGTQGQGTTTGLVAFSLAPDPLFPCGAAFPGWGMSAPGAAAELLLDPAQLLILLPTTPWGGVSQPALLEIPLPLNCTLLGTTIYAQGILSDGALTFGVGGALTAAIELTLGS